MNSYPETLEYLYNQLPMFQRIGPQAFKKDLTNIKSLCKHLKNPHQQFKSIHIAGTNGKGSVAHMLAAILQTAGYKVGLYTSPHLRNFRERIKVNGEPISEKGVIEFVHNNKGVFDTLEPSFFEMTVALAFEEFAKEQVDIAIIETGLGGRFDSTNIISPILSIITNISYDHQQFLGDTLDKIAMEKAGIIKPGVPVIVGVTNDKTQNVFIQKAQESFSEVFFADKSYTVSNYKSGFDTADMDIEMTGKTLLEALHTDMAGTFQQENIITTIKAIEVMNDKGYKIDHNIIRSSFDNVKGITGFEGRWHLLGRDPLVIADCAHNAQSIQLIMEQLKTIDYDSLHIVFGMVKDKKADDILKLMEKTAKYYFCRPDIPRGLDQNELQKQSCNYGLNGRGYSSVNEALMEAKKISKKEDLIFIGGSSFVVSEVLR